MTDRANIPTHSALPWVPATSRIKPDSACLKCPLLQAAGHETCEGIKPPLAPAPAPQRVHTPTLRNDQWRVWKRHFDAYGFHGWPGTGTYPYNGRDSFNYVDSSAWRVVAASGKTLTLELPYDGDPRIITLYSYRRPDPQIGLRWVTGYSKNGVVQPGDAITFDTPSRLAYINQPVVLRIVSCDPALKRIVVETDKNCSGCLNVVTPLPEGQDHITCRVWQQAGNPEVWQHVNHATLFNARQRIYTFTAGDADENGFLQLSTGAVAHPPGFDTETPVLKLEAKAAPQDEWEEVPDPIARVFVRSGEPTMLVLGTALPGHAKPGHPAPAEDLTATYSFFRCSYFEEIPATETNPSDCVQPCYNRCYYARPDYSRSVGNYAAPDGTGDGGEGSTGPHWYCAMRRWEDFTDTEDTNGDGIDDKANLAWKGATGTPYFPRDGQCKQLNTCSHWTAPEPPEVAGNRDAIFDPSRHLSRYYRELWFSTDTRLYQTIIRVASFSVWQLQRVHAPSITYLVGWPNLSTRQGLHNQSVFYDGAWANLHKYDQLNDEDEIIGQLAEPHLGTFDEFLNSALPYPADAEPGPGHAPRKVANFATWRDPIDHGATIVSRDIERIGTRVQRDTGTLQGRGHYIFPKALPPGTVIIPNIDTTKTDGPQVRAMGTFTRYPTPQEVLGKQVGALIEINRLAQPGKTEQLIDTRTLHSITDEGDGTFVLDMTNAPHTFSYVHFPPGASPGAAETYDLEITWHGGAAPPFYPPDHWQVDSFYEPGKSFGAKAGGVHRGDTVGLAIPGFEDARFLVLEVLTAMGSEAPDWGDNQRNVLMEFGEFFAPAQVDVEADPPQEMLPPATGHFVRYQSSGNPLAPVDEIERPGLGAGEFWVPGGTAPRIYFSGDDAGKVLQVRYSSSKDLDPDDPGKVLPIYEETYLVPTTIEKVSSMTWADWQAATVKSVFFADTVGTALAPTTGTPTAGQYKATAQDVGGTLYVKVELATEAMGHTVRLAVTLPGTQTMPDDRWTLGSHLHAHGRRRDRLRIRCEAGIVASAIGTLPGTAVNFYWGAGVFVPPCTPQWVQQGFDTWAGIAGAQHISEHGRGRIYLLEDYFTDKPTTQCYRFMD